MREDREAERRRPSTGWLAGLADLSPTYFGLVMATGIVSLAASMMGYPRLGYGLFYLNIVQYAALWLLYAMRAWRFPRRFFGDMAAHLTGPGYLTTVAGTCILSSQFMLQQENLPVAYILWLLAIALWIGLTYAIFTALIVTREKPPLSRGIDGGWLLTVVASQALAVSGGLLATHAAQPYRLEMNLLALVMWLLGGMQYVWITVLIFYRYTFFRFSPRDLVPPSWINMGATAISTLAGSVLIQNAPDAPVLDSLLPFIKGFTLLSWATGTWWIPLLLSLEAWRHVRERVPLVYDAPYWGAVFPLGMYAASTWEMQHAMELDLLAGLARIFLYIALVAWTVTFAGMLRAVMRQLRERPATIR